MRTSDVLLINNHKFAVCYIEAVSCAIQFLTPGRGSYIVQNPKEMSPRGRIRPGHRCHHCPTSQRLHSPACLTGPFALIPKTEAMDRWGVQLKRAERQPPTNGWHTHPTDAIALSETKGCSLICRADFKQSFVRRSVCDF